MALEPIGIAHILLEDFFDFEPLHLIELLGKPIDLDQVFFKFRAKGLGIKQISHANPDPRHLVGIGGADAPPRRTDPARALRLFRRFVDRLVIGQDEMGALTDDEVLADLHPLSLEMIHLLDQRGRVHDNPVSDHTERAAIEDA